MTRGFAGSSRAETRVSEWDDLPDLAYKQAHAKSGEAPQAKTILTRVGVAEATAAMAQR